MAASLSPCPWSHVPWGAPLRVLRPPPGLLPFSLRGFWCQQISLRLKPSVWQDILAFVTCMRLVDSCGHGKNRGTLGRGDIGEGFVQGHIGLHPDTSEEEGRSLVGSQSRRNPSCGHTCE